MDWIRQYIPYRPTRLPPTWSPEASKATTTAEDWIDPDAASPDSWTVDEYSKRTIPQYVLDHAPLIHLHSDEPYWIADPAEHLKHITAKVNGIAVQETSTLANLANLNKHEGETTVFLTSNDDIEDEPPWLKAEWNIPTPYPESPETVVSSSVGVVPAVAKAKEEGWYSASPISFPDAISADSMQILASQVELEPGNSSVPGYSQAPGFLITVVKENEVLDAFWFIFNSFNLGNRVLGIRFGNHVGDWEHIMIRFQAGNPKALFTSRHSFGDSVYTWDALEKSHARPVVYSARGTHAFYTTPGTHNYVLPLGLLSDSTDKGPLWDPALNLKAYTYDAVKDIVRASVLNPRAPTGWLCFNGFWGDDTLPHSDRRQYHLGSAHHYSEGPTGPKFKNLERNFISEALSSEDYRIRDHLP